MVGVGATPIPVPKNNLPSILLFMLSVKQRGIEYHFSSLWYDPHRMQTLTLAHEANTPTTRLSRKEGSNLLKLNF